MNAPKSVEREVIRAEIVRVLDLWHDGSRERKADDIIAAILALSGPVSGMDTRPSNASPSPLDATRHSSNETPAPSGPASSVPSCLYCGEWDFSPNVECWEQYDVLVCEDCADQCHEDNSQFGVGA